MKVFIATLQEHPRLTSFLGTIAGWFSVENLSHAKDVMQLGASAVAFLVSFCALILTAPRAWAEVKSWFTPKGGKQP